MPAVRKRRRPEPEVTVRSLQLEPEQVRLFLDELAEIVAEQVLNAAVGGEGPVMEAESTTQRERSKSLSPPEPCW